LARAAGYAPAYNWLTASDPYYLITPEYYYYANGPTMTNRSPYHRLLTYIRHKAPP